MQVSLCGLDVSHLCIILYKIYSCVVLYKIFTLLLIKYTYIENKNIQHTCQLHVVTGVWGTPYLSLKGVVVVLVIGQQA